MMFSKELIDHVRAGRPIGIYLTPSQELELMRLCAIEDELDAEEFEEQLNARRKERQAERKLHQTLGIKPWGIRTSGTH